jgi:hypothetical protein
MWDWLIIAGLYLLGAGLLRWLGGFGAAGRALQEWGRRASAATRGDQPSVSG